MKKLFFQRNRFLTGFTLIEMLIVIAIIAVLAVATVMVLNPAELLKQARDSTRLSDLDNLNKAIALFQVQNPAGFIGNDNVVYVSLPATDGDNDCDEYNLPILPTGPPIWSYFCALPATYRQINNSGWVPIDFTSISGGAPLSILPVDPINTAANGLYFTYVRGGSWKMTAMFESQKKAKVMSSDGGPDHGIYEIGTNLNLVNGVRGLIGYWKLDEGSGTTANDSSGNGSNGTLIGNASLISSGQVGGAATFDGDGSVEFANKPLSNFITSSKGSMAVWIKPIGPSISTTQGAYDLPPVVGDNAGYVGISRGKITTVSNNDRIWVFNWDSSEQRVEISFAVGQWTHIAWVHSGGFLYAYKDGQLVGSIASGDTDNMAADIMIGGPVGPRYFTGMIDDVRIYNRALSASEIQALYNATK